MVLPHQPTRLPAVFISHGMPSLAVQKNAMTNALMRMAYNLPKPNAVVILSAHWQTKELEVCTAPHLSAWHDYIIPNSKTTPNQQNNPFNLCNTELQQLKSIKYTADGDTQLAHRILDTLHNKGFSVLANGLRPMDHGVWIPLMLLYPDGDVPVVQISLPMRYDAYACYQLGGALEFLREEQILIIGSGSITHNLDDMLSVNATNLHIETECQKTKDFKAWLLKKLNQNISEALDWQNAPFHQYNHPTKEHLMPLFFALGAGEMMSIVHSSTENYTLGMDILRFD